MNGAGEQPKSAVPRPGLRLGPYEITGRIGVGGMGEVYRARDPRLGRDVAIKVLPVQFAADPDRLRRFVQEARAAAALNHPNILVLHDVGSASISGEGVGEGLAPSRAGTSPAPTTEGQPSSGQRTIHYLVTELLEGESLREQIAKGGLTVSRSVELGIQIARGLAAAHERGIVHRDLKPGNVFVTNDGTVKIVDFGLAKLIQPMSGVEGTGVTAATSTDTASGLAVGTVGYMAPEQIRLQPVDHRADVFAFGCVLYEMLSGRRAFQGETPADTMSAILTRDPAPLSLSVEQLPPALDRIVRRCLEKRPDDRFSSARDLGFALQAVAESVPREAARRGEEIRPYPGLAAYTEADAERFFGRDEEIAALWRKIADRDLLGLIGPSGAGKTSFMRAGIVPHAPPGWRCLVATPGQAPFAALARAFVPQFAGDTEATSLLFQIHEPEVAVRIVGRWRERCDHALLIVDQFEELFTLNGEDVQIRFADLLGRISALDGVHVLLSMRDDFFFQCSAHDGLGAIFGSVTPLRPLTREALCDALVKPAQRFGFGFEDNALVEEMVQAVEGERGALPLLAFAVARLWDERDRERKLLTREAYEHLGGVAGALARHAEATLERVGAERQPIVREVFRNLSTAQQTRCVVDAEELLSVFPEDQRSDARQVVAQLVDARLLTSFDVEAPDGTRHHRLEVVHESLLQRWPRLVRWQTQDADAAQLRDQLRQAAHLWEEKGRPDDLLWTGTSYEEYQVWRSRYPGGLSEVEETFAKAMVVRATHRRRVRRTVFAAVLAAVVLVAAGLGILLRKSVRETRRAEAEAARREAAQLLALGRLRLADSPVVALAYAIASLERSDNDPARHFAVEALWQGPPAFVGVGGLPGMSAFGCSLSPDGRWLACGGPDSVGLVSRETGESRQLSATYEVPVGFASDGQRLVTIDWTARPRVVYHVWAVGEGRIERTLELEQTQAPIVLLVDGGLLTFTPDLPMSPEREWYLVRRLSLDGSAQQVLGRWEPNGMSSFDVDQTGTWIVYTKGDRVLRQRLDALSAPPDVLGTHEGGGWWVCMRPWRDRAVTSDTKGEIRIWDVAAARLERTLKSPADARRIFLDARGRFLLVGPSGVSLPHMLLLFDLDAPRTAEPAPLLGSEVFSPALNTASFSPDGAWLATSHGALVILWNTATPRAIVLGRQDPRGTALAFTRDGHLLSTSQGGVLRRWPLSFSGGEDVRVMWSRWRARVGGYLEIDPAGRFAVLIEGPAGKVHLVPLDGSPPSSHELKRLQGVGFWYESLTLDPSGRWLAMSVTSPQRPEHNSLQILDLSTGDLRTLDTHPEIHERCEEAVRYLEAAAWPLWLPDGRLITEGDGGLRTWDLASGTSEQLAPCKKGLGNWRLLATPDSHAVLELLSNPEEGSSSSLSIFDLVSRTSREITSHGNTMVSFAVDRTGTILVTGDKDSVVRVGPLSGEVPHLLFGHAKAVSSVAVSPDGRWIASGSDDGTIRLWPMPDLSKPPLHTLPHGELLAKLRSLTNLRAVRDPASDTGWKIEMGPFPGWATVPEWQP